LNAVRRSRGKPVVIALYLPASHPANNLLADSVILACGGTRIELGEEARLLSDPYFPKHEELSLPLYQALRQLSDFTVRNGEWMRPYALTATEKESWAQAELNQKFISIDHHIWTVARRYPEKMVIHLVNLTGLDPDQRWDKAHAAPIPCTTVTMKVQMSERPSRVFWDCPEQTNGPQILDFTYATEVLTFQIPQIHFTGLVAIHE
jgi:dextranase